MRFLNRMTFEEAFDLFSYERELEAGTICIHGYDIGKCKKWCENYEYESPRGDDHEQFS